MKLESKKVIVLGAGLSGCAAAELLLGLGALVTLRDSCTGAQRETLRKKLLGKAIILEEEGTSDQSFDLAIISPGLDPKLPMMGGLKKQGLKIISEIELAFQNCAVPVIAITGTNGKSTTTQLIEKILLEADIPTQACGNIGKPFSSVVQEKAGEHVITLEVSSFQLEAIDSFRPHVAVYLNFTPDHLDRYESLVEYQAAKDRIFLNQTNGDFAVVNANLVLPSLKAKKITISSQHQQADYYLENGWLCAGRELILAQTNTQLSGPHNAENMLAALAVADIYQVPREQTIRSLQSYVPLPHRCENVRKLDGVSYVNDSKATNLDAMEKALIGCVGQVVLIAGGKDKGFDFRTLGALIQEKVSHAIILGEVQNSLNEAWETKTNCHRVTTLPEAVQLSQELAESGMTVLLSPGCSSYDMFKNFEDRGDQFRNLTNQLKSKNKGNK